MVCGENQDVVNLGKSLRKNSVKLGGGGISCGGVSQDGGVTVLCPSSC